MKRHKQSNIQPLGTLFSRSGFLAAIGCAGVGLAAHGQNILAPPPTDFSQEAPALRPPALPQSDLVPVGPGQVLPDLPPWLRYKTLSAHPGLLYRFSYGDGIPASNGNDYKTVIQEIIPSITFNLGSHWTLGYTPTIRLYSNNNFKNGVDQSVMFSGGTVYENWVLGLSQSYLSTFQPLIETGQQTDQQVFATGLNATYHFNAELSLEMGVNQNLRYVENIAGSPSSIPNSDLQNSEQWSTLDWLNYQYSSKVAVAFGLGGGYVNLSSSSDMTYFQVQGRINWKVSDKFGFTLTGGFEDRQFLDSGEPNLISPLFGLNLAYQPFEYTTLSLNASHAIDSSYFTGQITEDTVVSANLRQRLLGKLNLSVGGGYRFADYKAVDAAGQANPRNGTQDTITFLNVRLGVDFLKRGSAAIFYYFSNDNSSDGTFSNQSQQVGFEIAYRY
jgi:hypothetical protein